MLFLYKHAVNLHELGHPLGFDQNMLSAYNACLKLSKKYKLCILREKKSAFNHFSLDINLSVLLYLSETHDIVYAL